MRRNPTVKLPKLMWDKLDLYRAQRREEHGKFLTRQGAITEILTHALDGVEPPKPTEDRLKDLEARMAFIEEATHSFHRGIP